MATAEQPLKQQALISLQQCAGYGADTTIVYELLFKSASNPMRQKLIQSLPSQILKVLPYINSAVVQERWLLAQALLSKAVAQSITQLHEFYRDENFLPTPAERLEEYKSIYKRYADSWDSKIKVEKVSQSHLNLYSVTNKNAPTGANTTTNSLQTAHFMVTRFRHVPYCVLSGYCSTYQYPLICMDSTLSETLEKKAEEPGRTMLVKHKKAEEKARYVYQWCCVWLLLYVVLGLC